MKRFKWLQYALHAAVLIGLIVAGLKYINGGEFWGAMHRFNWVYAPVIMSLAVGYVLVKGWRFVYMMRQLTDLSRWVILKAYIAGQACTLLPGGVAARAGILEQAGVPAAESAAPIAISSLSDQILLILCSVIAALWFEQARKPVLIFLSVLAVISLLLGIEAVRTWLLRVIERLMGRFKLLHDWREFVVSLKEVTTVPILLGGLWNTAISFVVMVAALDLAVLGVGARVSYFTLLLAFTLPALMGRISALPGGVGVTEAGMVSILDHAPGVALDQAAAGVAVFRVGTTLWSAVFGALVYWLGWRKPAEEAALER